MHHRDRNAHRAWANTPKKATPQRRQEDKVNKTLRNVVIGALLLGAFLLVGFFDKQSNLIEERQYCRMVHLGERSGGELGWPDYRGTYAAQCTPDGRLRQAGG